MLKNSLEDHLCKKDDLLCLKHIKDKTEEQEDAYSN